MSAKDDILDAGDELMLDYRVISGKIFNNKNEEITRQTLIANMRNRDFWLNTGTKTHAFRFSATEAEKILNDLYIAGDPMGMWPDLPLIALAKKQGPLPKDTKLAFNLDPKQLIIINRLLYHPEDEGMFITTGVGGSGKSTYLNIIKQLFDNDVSPTSIKDLTNEFTRAEAVKCRLIASDELDTGELDAQFLKKLASKQDIECNPKFITAYHVKAQSALFWCCNNPPKIDCEDTGLLRRILFYSRNEPIQNPDPSLNKKIFTKDDLLKIARVALAYEENCVFQELVDRIFPETRWVIMEQNSVYKAYKKYRMHNTGWPSYREYRELTVDQGLRPYAEPKYEAIQALFKDWLEQARNRIDLGD